jgi:hypothetical protein
MGSILLSTITIAIRNSKNNPLLLYDLMSCFAVCVFRKLQFDAR